MTERRWTLLLCLLPQVGNRTLRSLLERQRVNRHTPEELMALPPEQLREEYTLPIRAVEALKQEFHRWYEEARRLEEHLSRCGVRWVTFQDAAYPAVLETMAEPPAVLFGYGNWSLLEAPTFATLASHKVSKQGLQEVETVVASFLEGNWVLVTGHNQPAYRQALLTALRMGKPQILVLDSGLLSVFGEDLRREPFAAARIWRTEFNPSQDLALSPFRPRDPWIGHNSRYRDRLVATLAEVIVAVEVRAGGFMETLCLEIRQTGKKLYVCARDLQNREGNRHLIEAGGIPLGGSA